MKHPGSEVRAILGINAAFFIAACVASLARAMWPATSEWWQFGLYALVLYGIALTFVIQGVKALWGLIWNDIEQLTFHGRGREASSDRLADDEAMREGDML